MAYRITIEPRGLQFSANADQSLLEAAEAAGVSISHSCDAGTCRLCRARLLEGELVHRSGDFLKAADAVDQDIYCCLMRPRSDCRLSVEQVLAPGELPGYQLACQVADVRQLSGQVKQVWLRLPAGKRIRYLAGQYLELVLDDATRCPFSIACAPGPSRLIELHIRHVPESALSVRVNQCLQVGEVVQVALPKGRCTLLGVDQQRPILFLAGSTGFAPIKAMLEEALQRSEQSPLYLYWGGRTRADLYLHDWVIDWAAKFDRLTYVPVISEPECDASWAGRKGLVHQAVLDDFADLHGWIVVAGGSPPMVYTALDAFTAAGLNPGDMMSDVFEYAPRV
jgi:CDP-4-dehydro-6-deoxyglucose reductase